MLDDQDYKLFLRDLSQEDFRKFVAAFGGESKCPDDLIGWVTSPEREKSICNKIRQVFGVDLLTANERQERIASLSAEASQRQATAAEKANDTAERALRVAEQSMYWTKLAGIVAVLALIVSAMALVWK